MTIDLEFDRDHIWHQYSSLTSPIPTYPIVKTSGAHITLEDGTDLIDGMSSWWCQIHGGCNEELNQAIYDQVPKFTHFMFAGISHEPAVQLSKKLISMTAEPLDSVFYAESGSVAVEVGLKLAHLYWAGKREKNETKFPKDRFLTVNYGYHGDTFGAMSVCDPINSMHRNYSGYLTNNFFVDAPKTRFNEEWDPKDFEPLKKQLISNHERIAAVILEPIVQGAGGMRIYHPEYLRQLRKLCDEYNVLVILDEIATGFGRTGKLFAHEHSQIIPDILLCGKGLTGGYLPLSAVLMTRDVSSFVCESPGKRFFHGPTYMANALACAVGNKSLEILQRGHWINQVNNIEKIFNLELFDKIKSSNLMDSTVDDIRGIGALAVIQLKTPYETEYLQKKFVESGAWVRPFGKLIYLMPPFIIEEADLIRLCEATINVLKQLE
ncbi:Glutamate-1-semialdehyde 2,1-aminomutase [Wickerhamomyces ciferrii]|uniref:Acetylornithine aminotransferase, mitochondrial n=1 Tax=Wickerhamomyces ciferrii (strain ATCC 14091 / BCRC 22168 / CBS 111 / JCM 3599 / NBRC 0793 / NRRL Y-1031 F-60-10) TaxID=1206466 RepID=K0KU71_WICCF|nr:Glutamate-1-semialdehyde 2,1-aminomutase [Wickerhamomyces ciferrii]CCH46726.1 Glutamate-1-semialdehyde 2,1-aminomutase [Wickerhamomyces ciferrii]